MTPIEFEGSVEISKPKDWTDEQCMSAWAKFGFGKLMEIINVNGKIPNVIAGIDADNFPYYMTAWKPNYEDIKAINEGRPVYVKVLAKQLPPMALFTLDENNAANF